MTRGDVLQRISLAVLIGCGVGLVQATALAQTKHDSGAGHYEITGVVINSVNGNPVPRCHLTASLGGSPGGRPIGRGGFANRQFPAPADGFDCDAHGRFVVTVPSAGAWQLMASARGFVSQQYDEHQGFFSAIVLTADAPTKEIEFRLGPEASIVGVVLDEAGEPVRNAQLALQSVPRPVPGGPQPAGNMRGGARTDDRGMYELPNLAPGEYRLSVRAQPWYAANTQGNRGNDNGGSPLDPSLDFAYPATWFPGVSDPSLAETIVLHAGDTRQADFRLIPIPSLHLKILTPPRVNNAPSNSPVTFPMIQQVNPGGGGLAFVPISTTRFDQQGQIDVGGLTPGLYEVRLGGPNQDGRVALVELTANSSRTVDLSGPVRDLARITLRIDGIADSDSNSRPERNVQVILIDTDTHRGSFSTNGGQSGGPNLGRRDQKDPAADRILEVPPGRYEVVLQGRPNIFLTGLTGKGAETAGRYVTVGAGESALTVHVASGRASLSGVATFDGKPAAGAMVLLVPITIEDPNSIGVLRQDQTNTDGSFDVANIIPGQYILIAIDHGWGINWGDASTLRRYLMQGVPVELKPSVIVKQNVTAQVP